MNTYEINDRNEVVPYTSGRRCTDTMAWRDATELELQQQDEIKTLETELTAVTKQLKAAQDGWHDEITKGLTELRRAESIYTKAQERAEKAEEQRDRLAVALQDAMEHIPSTMQKSAIEALAAVKGGSDE